MKRKQFALPSSLCLYVVRHAETEANTQKRYLGHTDSPLTPLGVRQVEELAGRLAEVGLDAVFASDLPRALATAYPLANRAKLPVHRDARLRELNFGRIEGMTYAEAMDAYGQEVRQWYNDIELGAPPGGESLADLRERVFSFLSELAELPYRTVALVTHGGVCNLLLSHALGQPFRAHPIPPSGFIKLRGQQKQQKGRSNKRDGSSWKSATRS
jgi:alpha-ribazole phosphatase